MNTARTIIWLALAVLVVGAFAWDMWVAKSGGLPTISAALRAIDAGSGGLFRWLLLANAVAVWLHLFIRVPWGSWS
jgi:hypothetical protein